MTGDEIGLNFFIDEGRSKGAEQPSVFGAVDQEAIIAKLDTNEDDDLGSDFFGDSIAEVEDAAVRMFDVGIRTITQDGPPPSTGPAFGATVPQAAPAGAEPDAVTVAGHLADDPVARAAFILGGPAALD